MINATIPIVMTFEYDDQYWEFLVNIQKMIPKIKGKLLGYDVYDCFHGIFYLKKDKKYKELVKKYTNLNTDPH